MRTVGGRTVADWFLLLRVAVASLAGGLVAVGVLWFLEDRLVRLRLVLFLVVLVAVLIVLAIAALMSDRRGPAHPGAGGPPPLPRPVEPRPELAARGAPVPDRRHAGPGRGRGWAGPAAAPPVPLPVFDPPPPVQERVTAPPAVDEHAVPGAPPGAAAVRRIVQCPRCGDFGIVLRREAELFAFACRRCAHTWQWGAGLPWPTTVVRPPGAERSLPPDPTSRRSQ